jgi:DNA-binding transcriptional MerR regulator
LEKQYFIDDLIQAYSDLRDSKGHLKELGDLEQATVRFYQQKSLFEPVGSEGKKAIYGEEVLWRIIFTRLAQRQSRRLAGEKATIDALARWMYPKNNKNEPDTDEAEERLAAIKRVVLGQEKLSVEVLPNSQGSDDEWSSVVKYRGVEIMAKRKPTLGMAQTQQLKIVAKLVESILEGS